MRPHRIRSGFLAPLLLLGCSEDPPLPPVDTSEERLVPEEYETIAEALAVARSGDTISLAPGTYEGIGNLDLVIDGIDIEIRARQNAVPTILDMNSEGRAFDVVADGRLTLDGLILANGSAGTGGAIRLSTGRVFLRGVRIHGASAEFAGAISVDQGILDLEDCELLGNSATLGDGGAIFAGRAVIRIDRTVISGNYAKGSGAALSLDRSTATLKQCTVASNRSGRSGGALEIWRESAVRLERSLVWGNTVDGGDPEASEIRVSGSAVLDLDCCLLDMESLDGEVRSEDRLTGGDPFLCSPADPASAPTTLGDYGLQSRSPCLAELSPCGSRIGARDGGCNDLLGDRSLRRDGPDWSRR